MSTKEEVRRFIGMISYYRKFIKDFILGKTSTSLCQFTGKYTSFVWSDEHESAFEKLKQGLVREPILVYPNFNEPFEIFIVASLRALGTVLSQTRNGVKHPVTYASRQMNKHEVNWFVSKKVSHRLSFEEFQTLHFWTFYPIFHACTDS